MNTPNLQQLSEQLVYLAQLMAKGVASESESQRFCVLLSQILELPSSQESIVTARALSALVEIGDDQSARWLAEEFDIECQLQYLKAPSGREKACLLFALPVVVPCADSLRQHATHNESFVFMQEVLSESDVVSQAAVFSMVPRLFSYSELFSKSYGDLRRLTRELAHQVLGGATQLSLPRDFDVSATLEGPSCSSYVDLYFVVGMVCTEAYELDDVFPALFYEDDSSSFAANSDTAALNDKIPQAGVMADGEPWEKAFCEAFDDAFSSMYGSLSVAAPDGLTEDLRRGLELSRELGLIRMFELNAPRDTGAWARLGPLTPLDGELFIEVSCVSGQGAAALETMRWTVLNHESESDALEKLLTCLQDTGIPQEFPLTSALSPLGSLTLH